MCKYIQISQYLNIKTSKYPYIQISFDESNYPIIQISRWLGWAGWGPRWTRWLTKKLFFRHSIRSLAFHKFCSVVIITINMSSIWRIFLKIFLEVSKTYDHPLRWLLPRWWGGHGEPQRSLLVTAWAHVHGCSFNNHQLEHQVIIFISWGFLIFNHHQDNL